MNEVLHCNLCHSALTKPVRVDRRMNANGKIDDSIFSMMSLRPGQAIRTDECVRLSDAPGHLHYLVWILIDDFLQAGEVGTFGADGMDGPNKRCSCGNVIGTEVSVSWSKPHRFVPLPEATYWKFRGASNG